MTAEALIQDLACRGVRIVADRGDIEIHAAAGVLTAADREQLRTHKREILARLAPVASCELAPEWQWRSEYMAELGRLCVLLRNAPPEIADSLRQLARMPVPTSFDQWIALGTTWRRAELDLTKRGAWPVYRTAEINGSKPTCQVPKAIRAV